MTGHRASDAQKERVMREVIQPVLTGMALDFPSR